MKNFYSLKTNLQTADAGYVTFTKILFVLTSLLIIASPIFSQSNDSTQVATAAKDDVFMPKLQKYLTPDGKGNLTFTPGVRMQVRYEYNTFDQNNDFFIRRMRVKGSGNIFDVKF